MKEKKKLAIATLNSICKNIEKIYINENLSQFSRDLLYHTRRFQKANGWKFSWSSGGVVLMREKETSCRSSLCRRVKKILKVIINYHLILNINIFMLFFFLSFC